METTPEERMAVRRDECLVQGHRWDAVVRFGKELPTSFVCSNCGRRILTDLSGELDRDLLAAALDRLDIVMTQGPNRTVVHQPTVQLSDAEHHALWLARGLSDLEPS